MTPSDLHALCERFSTPSPFLVQVTGSEIITMARECLRLLDENEAMRGVVDAAKNLTQFLPGGDTFGAGKYSAHNVAVSLFRDALSKLDAMGGERT